jgi:hypothetical protein
MARTWTWQANLAGSFNPAGNLCQPPDWSAVYYYSYASGGAGGVTVYKWDGSAQTNLSGFLWTAAQYVGKSIAWFNGELYFMVEDTTGGAQRVSTWRYDGSGQDWTQVWQGVAPPTDSDPNADIYLYDDGWMASTETHLYCSARGLGGSGGNQNNDDVFDGSTDGASWAAQNYGGNPDMNVQLMYGKNHFSGYDRVVALITDGATIRFAASPASGNSWVNLTDTYGGNGFWGYTDGFSQWVSDWLDTPPFQVYRSSDWVPTLENPSPDLINPNASWGRWHAYQYARQISNVSMACTGYDQETHTYDGARFVYDGILPDVGYNAIGFFRLGSDIYAVGKSSGFIRVYGGGAVVSIARFYQGINGLVERSQLPAGVTGVTPDGLLIKPCGLAVIGSRAANAIMVAQADPAVDYAVWDDLTGSLDTANGITALRLIQ